MRREIALPGFVVLGPSAKLWPTVRRRATEHRDLPDGMGKVLADLAGLRYGVPAVLQEPYGRKRDWSLGLHTEAYVVWLYPSQYQDAYTIAAITPMTTRDHDRLARGHLVVRTRWHGVDDHKGIPHHSQSHWQTLWSQWHEMTARLGDDRGAPALNSRHEAYLRTLDGLIDATQRIAEEQREATQAFPYRRVRPTGERRHSASPVYVFEVSGNRVPDRDAFVRLKGQAGQRGQVVRVQNGEVTIRFDQPVDWDKLNQQGELEPAPSDVVYTKQREAVALLRTRQACNRFLLDTLVDHKVRSIGQSTERPAGELDDDQLVAFRRALGVQDMMVVLGPPGTGKTRTISEIARSYALAHDRGRVLVASHTNRAVDNVLAKLPKDVTIVRIGNEGKVGPEGRPFLLERQAVDLRSEITRRTGQMLRAYEHIDMLVDWTDELGRRLADHAGAVAEQQAAETELHRLRRVLGGPAQTAVADAATVLQGHHQNLANKHRAHERLSGRRARSAARSTWPVLGALFRALTRSRDKRIGTCLSEIAHIESAVAQARAALDHAEKALDDATRHLPEVQSVLGVLRSVAARAGKGWEAVGKAAGNCRDIVATMGVPSGPDDPSQLRAWLAGQIPVLRARATLLKEWHDAVSGATQQLYPELIRYADVVGATCIGAASRPEISEVDFELAIIDEAGQIGVTDVLVPLVRADRAVLVGDHKQLPPFVDSELKTWARSLDDSVRHLLTKSALEILVEVLPPTHVKLLSQQRRMPGVIADFISGAFYDGKLRTMVERVHRDPVFRSPLAFVDTTRLPENVRAERSAPGGKGGCENLAEARLLSRLAAFYHRHNAEWAVIVPYAAQIKLIRDLLGAMSLDEDVIEGNVGTVDSFQGGERDVILYGFTRSNRAGKVGFLDELRRANVAFTRTKRQLVLVGDMGMLLRATDDGFRELITAFRDHIRAHGDVRGYREMMSSLDAGENTP